MKLALFLSIAVVATTACAQEQIWLRPGESITASLPELAERQGMDPDEFRRSIHISTVHVGGENQIAVLTYGPGYGLANLLLVSRTGKIWDHLRCRAHERYNLQADVHDKPSDGAYVVVRLLSDWYGWYTIDHGGITYFIWQPLFTELNAPGLFTLPPPPRADESWKENGLCRIGLTGGRFEVLYPKLMIPDLRHAKAVHVTYEVDGRKKKLPLVDRSILAKVTIKAIHYNREPPQRWDFPTTLAFTMPDESIIEMSMVVPAELFQQNYGIIELSSDKFCKALSSYLFTVEGRPVEVVRPYDPGAHPSTAAQHR